jgi:DNA-binding response OmpR family regulator
VVLCERCRAELAGERDPLPPWVFDTEARAVVVAGERRRLKRRHWQVLEILWCRRGRIVGRESMMTLLYGAGPGEPPQVQVLDVYVCQLRQALRGAPIRIETVWREGWRLDLTETAQKE